MNFAVNVTLVTAATNKDHNSFETWCRTISKVAGIEGEGMLM
jgi:hypothetical protein